MNSAKTTKIKAIRTSRRKQALEMELQDQPPSPKSPRGDEPEKAWKEALSQTKPHYLDRPPKKRAKISVSPAVAVETSGPLEEAKIPGVTIAGGEKSLKLSSESALTKTKPRSR